MKLDEFIKEAHHEIEKFAEHWKKEAKQEARNSKKKSDFVRWPLEMNEVDWWDQFTTYISGHEEN